MTWDSAPKIMLTGGGNDTNFIYITIPKDIKTKLRHKLERHILK